MTEEMFNEITAWQRSVFTKATAYSAIKHLEEEVPELIHELTTLKTSDERIKNEYADCFLLLFGSAALFGMTYENICKSINDKMEINKERKWGGVNDQGYVKHIEP